MTFLQPNKDIRRFHVPVDDLLFVSIIKRIGDTFEQFRYILDRKPSPFFRVALMDFIQRISYQPFHYKIKPMNRVVFHRIDRTDILMIQLMNRLKRLLNPEHLLLMPLNISRDKF